jgi:putative membrane protein
MPKITNGVIGLVILLHIAFLVMEMFLWTTPAIMTNFHLTPEQAMLTAPLAANQGLYNGFLAIGLLWAWFVKRVDISISLFFLICMIVAGSYGAATVKPSILLVQTLPAAIGLLLIVLRKPAETPAQQVS